MRLSVQGDLSRSAAAFKDIVWPQFSPLLGGGDLVTVESVSANGFNHDLDTLAGIDAWQIRRDNGTILGIASRAQPIAGGALGSPGPIPYDTFTIRWRRASGGKTEYAKRLDAIEQGAIYPAWSIHAYYSDGMLLSGMACRTLALYQLARRCVDLREFDGYRQGKPDLLANNGWGVDEARGASKSDCAEFIWMSFGFTQQNVTPKHWHSVQSLSAHWRREYWMNRKQEAA